LLTELPGDQYRLDGSLPSACIQVAATLRPMAKAVAMAKREIHIRP